jgi:predicted extracellular nuclease
MLFSFRNATPILKLVATVLVSLTAFTASQSAMAQAVFINEIHYDNSGTDSGEAVEVAGPAGTDLTGWNLVFYNGSGGAVYGTAPLSGSIPNIDNGYGMVVVNLSVNGFQNGAPDGLALVNNGTVEQFLSYEGSFTAVGGPADGMTSVDIGVSEGSSTAVGDSLQLTGAGSVASDFTWAAAQPNTFGATNTGQSFAGAAGYAFINEIHYDNTGGDTGEGFEVAGTAGLDLSGWSVVLYNGNGGSSYATVGLSGVIPDQDNGYGTLAFSQSGIQNGSPDGLALVNGTDVIEFLSYEGSFTAVGGPADGMSSIDIGVTEPGDTAVGDSLQLTGTGTAASDFSWAAAQPNTFGSVNTGQSFGGVEPPSIELVINEIHADPASDISGDANGDGLRDSSDDEFVELVNPTSSDLDISGWTLSDGFGLRHIFPSGSIVQAGCSVVVFGGNTPTGAFGASLVQVASTGALGLNNSGDSVMLSDGASSIDVIYGGEGGDNQSLARDPDITGSTLVKHTTATGAGGALFSPGTQIDGAQFSGCDILPQGPYEIYEIQGAGDASPYTGQLVVTTANVVTAVGTDGFFVQTQDGLSDNNVDTSDGIFVYMGGTPTVNVGDVVVITGQVREYFNMTEITGDPIIEVVGATSTPTPVVFDANVPSPDPASPSCAIEFECYEGMLVQITNGTVGESNQRFGSDPLAEVVITAASERPFREPGVEFPGLGLPPIATWDGNPEIFELDPDKLGLPNQVIPAGSHFDAVGVIGYEFGDYELWPSSLTVSSATIPAAVRDRQRAEFTVGSLNLFRLFDDINDPPDTRSDGATRNDSTVSAEEYLRRRVKFADYIVNVLGAPDILAVQEVEKLEVLQELAADITSLDSAVVYTALLEEGNDVGTIDVGFLVRDTVAVDAVTQLNKDELFAFDGSLLHDRPPLLLEARSVNEGADYPVAVMVVHNRSLSSIDSPSSGERVRAKRLAQAESIAQSLQQLQTDNPAIRLVIVGDFNAFEFSDGYVDAMGVITGSFDADASLLPGTDYVDPDLINQVLSLAEDQRYSYVFEGSAQTLDHALTSSALDQSIRGLEFGRGNADAAENLINDDSTALRSSDHDGLVLFITKDLDNDGVNDDADACPATVIPETPTEGLGVNRFALTDEDFMFDTVGPRGGGKGPRRSYSTVDTAGCSCTQIIAAEGLGKGHSKFGCSIDVMDSWVNRVQSQ